MIIKLKQHIFRKKIILKKVSKCIYFNASISFQNP